ncbi:FecCD family ABC transporter permease [Nocardioides alkalitolerans]|uniref:FecCD family ABC transporter permease n=1 Tax=Nocardioides alkalitolerans TaxID=281714 RepID=UPI0004025765|nr:iron chelate uptake ABC transporter family permease subunit [Nocardioides alkalitolerans]
MTSRTATPVGARRRRLPVVLLAASLPAAVALSLLVGSNLLPPGEIWAALTGGGDATASYVVEHQRLPRTVAGIVVGLALGVSGALMQAYTRNPFADPGLFGVSAGASFAVAVAVAYVGVTQPAGYVGWAVGGALLASLVVVALGRPTDPRTPPTRLVLTGVAVGAVLAGLTTGISLSDPDAFERMLTWHAGSLIDRGYDVTLAVLPVLLAGVVAAVVAAPSLNAVALGRDLAQAQGVDLRRSDAAALAAITLLAAAAAAVAGPVVFVGLVVPHVVRWCVGVDQRRILAVSAVAGVVLVLVADVVGRVAVLPGEMPAGIVTAFIGAPVLVALARRSRATGL